MTVVYVPGVEGGLTFGAIDKNPGVIDMLHQDVQAAPFTNIDSKEQVYPESGSSHAISKDTLDP